MRKVLCVYACLFSRVCRKNLDLSYATKSRPGACRKIKTEPDSNLKLFAQPENRKQNLGMIGRVALSSDRTRKKESQTTEQKKNLML